MKRTPIAPLLASVAAALVTQGNAANVVVSRDLGVAATGTDVSLGTGNPTLSWSAPTTWGANGHDYLDDPVNSITVGGISGWLDALEAEDPAHHYDSYTVTISFYSDQWWADGTWEEGWGTAPNLRYSGDYNGNGALSVDSGLLTYPTTAPFGTDIRAYDWTSAALTGDTFSFAGGPRDWDGSTDWRSSVDGISLTAIATPVPEPTAIGPAGRGRSWPRPVAAASDCIFGRLKVTTAL